MALCQLIVLSLLATGFSLDEAAQGQLITIEGLTIEAMEQVVSRSEEQHQKSMDAISSTMSISKAAEVLQKSTLSTPALVQATDIALAGNAQLRKQPKGYAGLDGARKLLNDMIFESMTKYDAEIARCTEFYSQQCAAMEVCRGQISAANYIAANSRKLILDSQSTINICEVDIPEREQDLKQHILKCKHELDKLNKRLKIVMGDIAVMTMILEMTDCEKKLLQTKKLSLLKCEDPCTKKQSLQFGEEGLQAKVSQLQSTVSHSLMQDTFADLFEGIEGMEETESLLQTTLSKFQTKQSSTTLRYQRQLFQQTLATTLIWVRHLQPTSVQQSAPSRNHPSATSCRSGSCLFKRESRTSGTNSWKR